MVFNADWLLAFNDLDFFIANLLWNTILNLLDFLVDHRHWNLIVDNLVLIHWLLDLADLLNHLDFWDWHAVLSFFERQDLVANWNRDAHGFDVNVLMLARDSLCFWANLYLLVADLNLVDDWHNLNFFADDVDGTLKWLLADSLVDDIDQLGLAAELIDLDWDLLLTDSGDWDALLLDVPAVGGDALLLKLDFVNALDLVDVLVALDVVRLLNDFVDELDSLVPNDDLLLDGPEDVLLTRNVLLRVAGVAGFSDDLRVRIAVNDFSAGFVDHIWLVAGIMDPLRAARVTILSISLIDYLRLLDKWSCSTCHLSASAWSLSLHHLDVLRILISALCLVGNEWVWAHLRVSHSVLSSSVSSCRSLLRILHLSLWLIVRLCSRLSSVHQERI